MKKVKPIFIAILVIIIFAFVYIFYDSLFLKNLEEVNLIDEIEKYDYKLYDNQGSEYKKLFVELSKVLNKDEIDEEEYIRLISKMFIIDFYTLNNKLSNLSIGGIEFLHSSIVDNFKLKAKDTIYKYVKSNVYGDRKQELPIVNSVTIESINSKSFSSGDISDDKAYYVTLSWDYKKDLGYDTEKKLIFIHENEKLVLINIE